MLGLGNTTPQMYSIAPVFVDDWSIQLNGTDESIECDSAGNLVTGWSELHEEGSMSIWAKINTTSSTGTIVRLHKDSNNFIAITYHASSNTTRATYKGDGGTTVAKSSEAVENSGNFHHIVCTWNASGQIKIYIDGNLEQAKPNSGTVDTWDTTGGDIDSISIGQNTQGSSFFSGKVNDFSLWMKEFTSGEVSLIYNNGKPNDVMCLGSLNPGFGELAAYYKFEDIYDTIGGFTATIRNHSQLYQANTATLINTPSYNTDVP